MITILNETVKPFKLSRGEKKEGRENRQITISYGKMKMEAFIKDEHIDKLEDVFAENSDAVKHIKIDNTRLYFNNKHYKPIIVGDARTSGADFLFFVQKVTPSERLVAVDHKSSAFVLESQRVKGEFIAGIVSFSISRPSKVTFITVDGGKYKYTTYSSDGKGNIQRSVAYKDVKAVKDLNTEMRAGIKPYRPFKSTHLVFVSERDAKDAEALFTGKNHQVVAYSKVDELRKSIESYKESGFTAATLFVGINQEEELSAVEKTHLQIVVDSFKVAHLTYGTGFTKFHSKPPVAPPRKPKAKQQKDAGSKKPQKTEGTHRRHAPGKKARK